MKEDIKTIFYMGLGAVAETCDKLNQSKEELFEKGKGLYERGIVVNEELKNNIDKIMKEKVTVVNITPEEEKTKEEILKDINKLSKKEKEELIKELNK